jgi:Nitronate monooxygenase
MLQTPLCTLLGIEFPIIQAGMGVFTSAELAAAVSNAGGLGSVGPFLRPFWGRFLIHDGLIAPKRWQDIPPWGIVWEIAFIPSPQGGHRCLATPVSLNGPP